MKDTNRHRIASRSATQRSHRYLRLLAVAITGAILPIGVAIYLGSFSAIGQAQGNSDLQKQEDQLIRQFTPPTAPPPPPVYRPAPEPASEPDPPPASAPVPTPAPAPENTSESPPQSSVPAKANAEPAKGGSLSNYVLEFSRSPIVGNSLRLRGTYAEGRLGFTRPRSWDVRSVKTVIRYQHSPALIANRSNLTVRVNGTSVGSIPLNRKPSQIGEFAVNIPTSALQNYNEITMVVQQNNVKEGCSDPADQTLWTEILPDSKLLFGFYPQAVPLDFSRYPYPFFDDLGLDAANIAYLLPKTMNSAWLTSSAQFQAGMGRLADFRPMNTQVVKSLDQVKPNQQLVVMGTPAQQPALRSLKLPYKLLSNQLVDGNKSALPDDVGLLMLTTAKAGQVPVLVITGNGAEGVAKAAQFLLQPKQRQMGTGSAILVDQLANMPTPSARQWSRYLPETNNFQLKELKNSQGKAWEDVTVRGAYTSPMEFDFRALPDDRFQRGSSMTLVYSHSPQVNPRLSTVEVRLDGTPIAGRRLTQEDGANRDSLNVDLPEDLVKPTSKIQVAFNLVPKELGDCGKMTDQQLWGKVHSDTKFALNRQLSVKLPDLKLLQAGYPFAAPQDLSTTAIALPDTPNNSEVLALLQVSERLGRLSQSDAINLQAFNGNSIPEETRSQSNLIGIGTRDRFPFPEVIQSKGFQLDKFFTRKNDQSQIQTLPDTGGVVKQIISPWNRDRVLLVLTAQNTAGLDTVRDVFKKDSLFFQLKDDTMVVNTTAETPSAYDPDAYSVSFFQQADQQRRIDNASPIGKVNRFLQENWYLLPTGIVLSALLIYGIAQLYLKRVANSKGAAKK